MAFVITDRYPDPIEDGVGDCIAFLRGEVDVRHTCLCAAIVCLDLSRPPKRPKSPRCKHCNALDEWFKRLREYVVTCHDPDLAKPIDKGHGPCPYCVPGLERHCPSHDRDLAKPADKSADGSGDDGGTDGSDTGRTSPVASGQ